MSAEAAAIVGPVTTVEVHELQARAEPQPIPDATGGGLLIAFAAVAAVAALVLGAVAVISETGSTGDSASAERDARQRAAIAILARPTTQRLQVGGADGGLILAVTRGGNAVLVGKRLRPAAEGWAYQAWVYPPKGGKPRPAGLFEGGRTTHLLTADVPPGAAVGVTLERESGSPQPTSSPAYLVTRPA